MFWTPFGSGRPRRKLDASVPGLSGVTESLNVDGSLLDVRSDRDGGQLGSKQICDWVGYKYLWIGVGLFLGLYLQGRGHASKNGVLTERRGDCLNAS